MSTFIAFSMNGAFISWVINWKCFDLENEAVSWSSELYDGVEDDFGKIFFPTMFCTKSWLFLKLFSDMCLCIGVCMCAHVWGHMNLDLHVCGHTRLWVSLIVFHLIFEVVSLTNLMLVDLANLADYWTPEIFQSLHPQTWDYGHMLLCLAFSYGWRELKSDPFACMR